MRAEVVGPVLIVLVLTALAIRFRLQRNRMRASYVQLEEYADVLLQHGQGMILSVQAIVGELSSDHPVRVRVEHTLARAERDLSELRETIQPHCSEQQQDTIR